jgi:putative ABC transport system permease protein
VLGFTLAVSLSTAVLFGLAPALHAIRVNVGPALKEQATSVTGGAQKRFRQTMVVGQVFLSLLLLIGAGLFVRTLWNLKTLDPGFRADHLIAFSVDPTLNGYTRERSLQFYRSLLDRLRATPAVESVALGLVRIVGGDEWDSTIAVEGYESKPGEDMNPYFNSVSPGYFSTLGIPVVDGREFTVADEADSRKLGIVNESFARHYFGTRSALGRHFGFGAGLGTKTDIEIVGVIRDTKYENMREKPQRQVFVPAFQQEAIFGMSAYVRTAIPPEEMMATVRRTLHALDPNLPVFALRTMDEQIDRVLGTERLVAMLAGLFGVLASLLAAIGLYGLLADGVVRRTREIGLRMALGAPGASVTWLVMRDVLTLVGLGVVAALPAAWAMTRLVKGQLYGVASFDEVSVAAAVIALGIIAAIAGYIPARRATRINPIQALRCE